MLGTNLVSRTKQALINICVKLAVHLIFPWLSGPALEHVTFLVTLPLHQPTSSLPVKFSGWGRGFLIARKGVQLASLQTLAAAGLCSGRFCCGRAAWLAGEPFLLAGSSYCRARLCPPSPSFWMPTDARANVSGEIRGRQVVSFLRFCTSPSPRPLFLADREVCAAESSYTWPPDPSNHDEGCWELSGGGGRRRGGCVFLAPQRS